MAMLFIGWFGPGGSASFVFTVMAIEAGVPGAEFISVVAVCTILMNMGHCMTELPFARIFALTSPGPGPPIMPDKSKTIEVK